MPTGTIFSHLKATVASLTNAIALHVAIVDGTGAQVTSFGGAGGTSDADGTAHVAGSTLGAPIQGLYESAPSNVADGKVGTVGMTTGRALKVSGSFSSAPATSATSALTSTADNVANVTVLASNANRLAFHLYNDSTSAVYVKCGAVATSSSFTKKLLPRESFSTQDIPVNYTGVIDAIWESAPGGAMRAYEFTA